MFDYRSTKLSLLLPTVHMSLLNYCVPLYQFQQCYHHREEAPVLFDKNNFHNNHHYRCIRVPCNSYTLLFLHPILLRLRIPRIHRRKYNVRFGTGKNVKRDVEKTITVPKMNIVIKFKDFLVRMNGKMRKISAVLVEKWRMI